MPMPAPQPIPEAAAEPIEFTTELVAQPDGFLPLNLRRGLYLFGIAAVVVAPIVAVTFPEYGDGIMTGGQLLAGIGLGTALANPSR